MIINNKSDSNTPSITHYHEISRNFGLQRTDTTIKSPGKQAALVELFSAKNTLIKMTEPFLYELYKLVEGTAFFLELLDEKGVILHMIGDMQLIEEVGEAGMTVGTSMTINNAGTNAISVAMDLGTPCQLIGDDHYLNIFHQFTCSCAPIHNDKNEIIGFINLNGYSDNAHLHTLGLVVAAVNAIGNQLLYENTLKEIDYANRVTNSVIESIDFGLMTIDCFGKIIFINSFAKSVLGDFTTADHYIYDYFLGSSIKEHILNSMEFHNDHHILKSTGAELIFDSHYIIEKDGRTKGFVLMLKTMDTILAIAHRYTNLKAKATFKNLITADIKIINLIRFTKKIANSPSNIHLTGEPGVGKTTFAESIHNESHRASLPFVTIDCAFTNDDDLLFDLFGGSESNIGPTDFSGKLKASLSGTIFLKNIEQTSLKVQSQLLTYLRTTKSKNEPLISRIISTSNKPLDEEVSKGNFNIELYYELCVIPITIPPLRDRPSDIKCLIDHFLSLKTKALERPSLELSSDVMNTLMTYNFPGNINELVTIVERLINLNGKLHLDLLQDEDENLDPHHIDLEGMSLQELEDIAIRACLKKTAYNYMLTAKKLGISRSTLYNKLKKLNKIE